jgi:hypothetical protein
MRADRFWGRLACVVGKHRRSKGRARHGTGASGRATYESFCSYCGIPMERLPNRRWIVSKGGRRSGGSRRAFVGGLAAVAAAAIAGGVFLFGAPLTSADPEASTVPSTRIAPDDPRLTFTDYAGSLTRTSDYAKIVRPIDTTDQGDTSGLRYAAPGARISFTSSSTAAGAVVFQLEFDGMMTRAGLYNAAGAVLVDGAVAATYDKPLSGETIPVGSLSVQVPVPAGRHVVSLVLPYAASARLTGVLVPTGTRIAAGPPAPALRIVLIGDSRFNGPAAANVTGTIGFQLERRLHAEVINLANGGRQLAPGDFTVAGALHPDLVYSLYDFNDFYPNGASLSGFGGAYALAMRNFLAASAAAGKPHAQLRIVTSFASTSEADFSPPGRYAGNRPTLEQFREEERRQVAALHNGRVRIVEGRGPGMPPATAPSSADGIHYSAAAQAVQAAILAAAR